VNGDDSEWRDLWSEGDLYTEAADRLRLIADHL
jgi:hypothetical protein